MLGMEEGHNLALNVVSAEALGGASLASSVQKDGLWSRVSIERQKREREVCMYVYVTCVCVSQLHFDL